MAIARTGTRLGLHSEARVRFERGVDPEMAPAAVERFVGLLAAVAAAGRRGTGPAPGADRRCAVDPTLPGPASVRLRTGRVNAILGTDLERRRRAPAAGAHRFRRRTGRSRASTRSHIPSWRLDCEREIDVIEEVARTWGYRRIERTVPPGAPGGSAGLTDPPARPSPAHDILAGAGYDEAWTTTFLAPGDLERAGLDPPPVEVENPLDRSESILRTELLPGLLKAVKFNVDRQAEDVCLFEIGHVFALPAARTITPDETERLAAIVAAWRPSGSDGPTPRPRPRPPGPGPTWPTPSGCRTTPWPPAASPGLASDAGRPASSASRGGAFGAVGEVDPDVVAAYGLRQRVGYLTVDVDALLGRAPPALGRPGT